MPNAILFYVLSKVFLFCIYHRVFVIEMFIYAILDIVFNNVVFEDAHLINAIYYTSIGFVTVGFFIALYLHQRYGDRKVHTHQTISEGCRFMK